MTVTFNICKQGGTINVLSKKIFENSYKVEYLWMSTHVPKENMNKYHPGNIWIRSFSTIILQINFFLISDHILCVRRLKNSLHSGGQNCDYF